MFCSDELPQTVTVKESISPAPGDASVKAESVEPPERQSDGGASSPQPPPPTVKVKTEVKKEEPDVAAGKKEEGGVTDGPCTKMTMRLRRNLGNPQSVSRPERSVIPVITITLQTSDGMNFSKGGLLCVSDVRSGRRRREALAV